MDEYLHDLEANAAIQDSLAGNEYGEDLQPIADYMAQSRGSAASTRDLLTLLCSAQNAPEVRLQKLRMMMEHISEAERLQLQKASTFLTTAFRNAPDEIEFWTALCDYKLVGLGDAESLLVELQTNSALVSATQETALLSLLKKVVESTPVSADFISFCVSGVALSPGFKKALVAELLVHTPDKFSLNIQTSTGSTPFLEAVSHAPEVVSWILDEFPDAINFSSYDQNGLNALHIAALYGHAEVFLQLLRTVTRFSYSDPVAVDFMTASAAVKAERPMLFYIANSPAYWQILQPYLEMLQLSQQMKSLHTTNVDGTPVLIDIYEGTQSDSEFISQPVADLQERILELIHRGIPVNDADRDGFTLLMSVLHNEPGNQAFITALEAAGASTTSKSATANTTTAALKAQTDRQFFAEKLKKLTKLRR